MEQINEIEKPKREYSWVKYIKQRVLLKNKNFLATLTGPTGSGKSWTGLSIGELIDPDFNEDRVVFSGSELMNLIGSGKLKSGSVIVWDEAGVNLSNKNWQSAINKLMNFLLQTFRHRNFVLIFTVPYSDFVDASTRKLFHADFQTVSINRQKNTCRIKPKLLQYNASLRKTYYHYLKMLNQEGGCKIKRWDVPKPSDDLIDAYEHKKTLFTNKLNNDIRVKMEQMEAGEDEENNLPTKQKEVLECWKKGISLNKDIAEELKMDNGFVSVCKKALEKKGFYKKNYLPKPKGSNSIKNEYN